MFKKFVTLGGVGLAGLALIGAGATATFTQSTTSNHPVQAGTMNVVLSGAGTLSTDQRTLTFAPLGPTGSSFVYAQLVNVKNVGDIPANFVYETLTAAGGSDLIAGLHVCISSDNILYNGPLSSAPVGQQLAGPLAANGGTDKYTVTIYAGDQVTPCGTGVAMGALQPGVTSPAPSLPNAAQGQSVTIGVRMDFEG